MTNNDKLYYQTCREIAQLTQQEACVLLNIPEPSTLSKYENGKIPVGQKLCADMVKVYRTPSLGTWHLRYANPDLAYLVPEPPEIKTKNDVLVKLEWAHEDIQVLRCSLKAVVRNGKITEEDARRLDVKADSIRETASKLMEIANFLNERDEVTP